jgi:hypothetical protein
VVVLYGAINAAGGVCVARGSYAMFCFSFIHFLFVRKRRPLFRLGFVVLGLGLFPSPF